MTVANDAITMMGIAAVLCMPVSGRLDDKCRKKVWEKFAAFVVKC